METSDKNTKTKRKTIITVILAILVLGLVSMLVTYTYLSSRMMTFSDIDFSFLSFSDDSLEKIQLAPVIGEITYDYNKKPIFVAYNNTLVLIDEDGINTYDSYGNVKMNLNIENDEPLCDCEGKYLVVFNSKGTEFNVYYNMRNQWSGEAKSEIVNVGINRSGYLCVVSREEDYKSSINMYTPEGELIKEVFLANDYCLDAKFLPDIKEHYALCVNVSGIKSESSIYFYKLSQENPYAIVDLGEGIFHTAKVIGDNILVFGENTVKLIDINRNIKWEKEIEKLMNVEVLNDRLIAVSYEKSQDKEKIVEIYDLDGKKLGEILEKDDIILIEAEYDRFVVVTARGAKFYDFACNLKTEYTSMSDIYSVHFISNRESAIVSSSEVIIIKTR